MADTPDVIQANSGDGAGTKFGFTEADDASYNVPWVELVMGDGLGYHWRIDSGHPLPVILGSNSGVTIGAVEQVGTWTINLPSGAATESGLTTINATLNSMYSVLTAMDVDTSAMALSLAAIETALGGTLTVGSHAVTNAGTFTVQESGAALTALQLIDNPVATISSTDVFRVAIFDDSNSQITSFGGTQYAVDAVLGSTPTGTVALAQRDDALSSLAPIEGDAVGLRVDANGALWVIPSGTVTVSGTVTANLGSLNGAATAANQSTANTYLFDIGALVDTIDGAVGDISATIGTHGSAGPTKAVSISGTDALGDCREILTDTSGRVYVNVSGTVTIADGGGSITVDATELTAIQAADEAIADGFATVAGGTPPNSMVQIGATAAGGTFHSVRTDTAGRLKIVTDTTARPQFDMYAGGVALITDASNGLLVDLGTNNDVVISDGGGSITVDGSVSISGSVAVTDGGGTLSIDDGGGSITIDGSLTTVSTVTTVSAVTALGTITGASVAHDSADSGNPHKIGMKAIAHSSNPTAVAVNDRTNWFANRHGVPWVIGGHPNIQTVSALVADSDGAQTNAAIVTVTAGFKIVVTQVLVHVDSDCTGSVDVRVGFAAATLATAALAGASGILIDLRGCIAGGGGSRGDGSGIIGVGADGEDVRFSCEDPAGGNVTITVSYYTIES